MHKWHQVQESNLWCGGGRHTLSPLCHDFCALIFCALIFCALIFCALIFLCPDFCALIFLCPDFCAPIFVPWFLCPDFCTVIYDISFVMIVVITLILVPPHQKNPKNQKQTNKQTKKTRISLYLKGLFVVMMKSGSLPLNTTCAVPVSHCHFKFLFSIRKVPWHFPVLITKRNSHQPVIKSMKFCDFNSLLRESFYSQDMKGTSISWMQCHFVFFFLACLQSTNNIF